VAVIVEPRRKYAQRLQASKLFQLRLPVHSAHSLSSAHSKERQNRAVAGKPRDAAVNVDRYSVQDCRQRFVLYALVKTVSLNSLALSQ